MTLSTLLAICALIATTVLVLKRDSRVVALVAVIAAALEVTMALGLVRFGVSGVPVSLVLAAVLAVCGTLAFLRVSTRPLVAAATVTVMVGVLQVVTSGALERLGL